MGGPWAGFKSVRIAVGDLLQGRYTVGADAADPRTLLWWKATSVRSLPRRWAGWTRFGPSPRTGTGQADAVDEHPGCDVAGVDRDPRPIRGHHQPLTATGSSYPRHVERCLSDAPAAPSSLPIVPYALHLRGCLALEPTVP